MFHTFFKKLYFLFNLSVQPTATLNDSKTITVPEHSDVYSSCEGKNGVPTSNVSWYKGNKLVVKGKILSFRNIKRDQAGSYTCKVQSGPFTDKIELKIVVQCKYLCISTDLYIKLLFIFDSTQPAWRSACGKGRGREQKML